MIVNGEEAFIERGTVRYYPISTLDTIDIKEIPAILSLKVTPTVSADNQHITMVVEVTDDRDLPAEEGRPLPGGGTADQQPGRVTKKITTTLMVKTGDTVVIGGIYQSKDTTLDSGVPWVKDIPFLGWLFKAQADESEKVELLIFLTPTVVETLIKWQES